MNRRDRERKHAQRVAHQREQRRKRDNMLAEIEAEAKRKKKGQAWVEQQMLVNGYQKIGNKYKRLPQAVKR